MHPLSMNVTRVAILKFPPLFYHPTCHVDPPLLYITRLHIVDSPILIGIPHFMIILCVHSYFDENPNLNVFRNYLSPHCDSYIYSIAHVFIEFQLNDHPNCLEDINFLFI